MNIYGRIIDNKSLSQKTRAKLGLAMWAIPQAAVFIWVAIIYSKFSSGAWLSTGIDFKLNTDLWAKTYLPYWIMRELRLISLGGCDSAGESLIDDCLRNGRLHLPAVHVLDPRLLLHRCQGFGSYRWSFPLL